MALVDTWYPGRINPPYTDRAITVWYKRESQTCRNCDGPLEQIKHTVHRHCRMLCGRTLQHVFKKEQHSLMKYRMYGCNLFLQKSYFRFEKAENIYQEITSCPLSLSINATTVRNNLLAQVDLCYNKKTHSKTEKTPTIYEQFREDI